MIPPFNRPRRVWFRRRRGRSGDRRAATALLGLALLACGARPAAAEPVVLGGITFSDELGGVVIRAGSGSGTSDDPFVLHEEINDDGPAVLVVRGLDARPGEERLNTQPRAGFALVKVVTNRTRRDWHVFEMELRETLERTSPYGDGLSFAQATPATRPFTADRFGSLRRVDEPIDAVEFADGLVRPGETVTVTAVVTDYTPAPEFFLLQRRDGPVSWVRRRGGPG